MACLCRRTDFSKLSQTFLFVAVWNVSKIKITHLLSQHFLCLSSRLHLALELRNWWKFSHHFCTSFVNRVFLKIGFVLRPLQPTSSKNLFESLKWPDLFQKLSEPLFYSYLSSSDWKLTFRDMISESVFSKSNNVMILMWCDDITSWCDDKIDIIKKLPMTHGLKIAWQCLK